MREPLNLKLGRLIESWQQEIYFRHVARAEMFTMSDVKEIKDAHKVRKSTPHKKKP